jgi:hypothetical protein
MPDKSQSGETENWENPQEGQSARGRCRGERPPGHEAGARRPPCRQTDRQPPRSWMHPFHSLEQKCRTRALPRYGLPCPNTSPRLLTVRPLRSTRLKVGRPLRGGLALPSGDVIIVSDDRDLSSQKRKKTSIVCNYILWGAGRTHTSHRDRQAIPKAGGFEAATPMNGANPHETQSHTPSAIRCGRCHAGLTYVYRGNLAGFMAAPCSLPSCPTEIVQPQAIAHCLGLRYALS